MAQPARPAPPTEEEITAYNQSVLDATMNVAGLDGMVTRETTSKNLPESDDDWARGMSACLSRAGYADVRIATYGKSYLIAGGESADPSNPDEQIALYVCLADHPANPVADGRLYSAAQRQYLWNYFRDWQLPCLRLHGYRVSEVPSRDQFLARTTGRLWTPYDGADSSRIADDTDGGQKRFETFCGPRLGVITTGD